jgi:predicted metal-dependent hydrolase
MQWLHIGELEIELHRKEIKNLHLSVLPPDGKIRVSAPVIMSDTAIRMAVISRIPWIKKQQSTFFNQSRQSVREMVSGECHYIWGKKYRLNIVATSGQHRIECSHANRLDMYVHATTSTQNKQKLLEAFYRMQLQEKLNLRCSSLLTRIGVDPSFIGIRKMKTRWGSANPLSKRIWLNLELAKKPVECLEFILVHELVHLIERHHNDRFVMYMDQFLPQWRERKALLNSLPLTS